MDSDFNSVNNFINNSQLLKLLSILAFRQFCSKCFSPLTKISYIYWKVADAQILWHDCYESVCLPECILDVNRHDVIVTSILITCLSKERDNA